MAHEWKGLTNILLDQLTGSCKSGALALGVTLVSHNTREFARVPGLRLANWLAAP